MPSDSLDARETRAAGPAPRRSRRASHPCDFPARPCMHWPLCSATKDAVPTFVSHRALCGLAAPITTIFREAKRGWPGFGASAFFFFLAMAVGARRRASAPGRFSCARCGLAVFSARCGELPLAATARARERPLCGLGCAVVFGSRARPRGSFRQDARRPLNPVSAGLLRASQRAARAPRARTDLLLKIGPSEPVYSRPRF